MTSPTPTTPIPHSPKARSQRRYQRRVFSYISRREVVRINRMLRVEFVGGLIIMVAALIGFIAANTPIADWYLSLRNTPIGPEALGLNLTVGAWASDGLLAIFFFMVGLELKREFVEGDLRSIKTAVVPVAAAFGGVAVPALIYLVVNLGSESLHGWAIPTATDIAFAVAVLGLIAPGISPALRMFLLTLAVVDDFIAIAIIAMFYTEGISLLPLLLAAIPAIIFAVLIRWKGEWFAHSPWGAWLILLPLGIITWALFHNTGIHATIAGVVLAFLVPVRGKNGREVAERMNSRFQPLSALIAVPIFAFFAAGVPLGGVDRFPFDPIAMGIMIGLVVGKPLGITITTWAITRFTRATLGTSVAWREIIGVGALAGVGFTVALLIAELSFTDHSDIDTARLSVMVASIVAVGVAALFLVPGAKKRAMEPVTQANLVLPEEEQR
ncbi:Na+/H+ antiporter NhaA [Leucobacter denitrificans]|uniref:Na(+)/H(+) antiporter NhaA n=1 Tax=Leucobacter denitrificans TaxID=683042 RepID=A0A7G9S4N0_9MICO|nr:Na+/H+ antiporter NhaA [Leucobacter denitrificans]QNN62805.1 Na+/H+ antiporter NhaA [Leucobacter denitrificans]